MNNDYCIANHRSTVHQVRGNLSRSKYIFDYWMETTRVYVNYHGKKVGDEIHI